MALNQAFTDLQEAWAPVRALKVEYVSSESNPHFANIVSPTEQVMVLSFNVQLDGGGGELHLTMPYSMIEPIRELLDSDIKGEPTEGNQGWAQTLREEVEDVSVSMVSQLGHSQLTLRQLLALKPGDVIPCDFDGNATLLAEGIPLLRGTYGVSRGQQAVKIANRVARRSA
jgi:flagellar motor switch protein FliM